MNSAPLDWPLIFAALFPWAVVTVAALITPRMTRPDIFFAITVKPLFRATPESGEIMRGYDRIVVIFAALALLPLLCFKFSRSLDLPGIFGPIAIGLVGYFCAFQLARRRTMPYHAESTAQREAVVAPRQASLPGGALAQAGPFLVLAAAALCLWLNWDRIPATIAIHWGARGLPNGWASKSVLSVFGGLFIGILVCLLLGSLCWAIVHGVRRINSSGSAAVREARFVRAISFVLVGAEYWAALLVGLLALAALRQDQHRPLDMFGAIIVAETLFVGSILYLCYRTGQGGSRLRTASDTAKPNPDDEPVGGRTPDECWKLGLFYFNSDDPALFVEKRFGVGWTLNFANPRCWLVIGAIVLFIGTTVALSLLMNHGG